MATGKYHEWLEPDGIERVTNWAAKGCTYAEIAHNMGISRDTLNEWMKSYPAISDAVKTGRALSITCIENMAFKVAMGLVEEETIVKVRDAEGGEQVRLQKRRQPPSTAMLIFLLKNRAGYRDNPAEGMDEALSKVDELLDELRRA